MTKFFNNFKKKTFWAIFGLFSPYFEQKNFSKFTQRALSRTRYGFLPPCQNLKQNFKRPDWGTEGRTDRPYFTGPFRLPLGIQLCKKLYRSLNYVDFSIHTTIFRKNYLCKNHLILQISWHLPLKWVNLLQR